MNKRLILIIVSIVSVIVISVAVVVVLHLTDKTQDTSQQPAISSSAEADKKKAAATDAANKGETDKAITLYKEARAAYAQLDAASNNDVDTAPNNNIMDIDAQISLLETVPPATPEPEMTPEEFTGIDTP